MNGQFSLAGPLLLNVFSSTDLVEKLISLGHLAKLGKTIDECISYSRDRGQLLRYYKDYSAEQAKMVAESHAYVWHPQRSYWTVGFSIRDPLLKTAIER